MKKSKNVILVCSQCGSEDIEEKQWRKVNTGEFSGLVSENNKSENQWCCNCEKHVTFTTESIFKQQQLLKD